MNRRYYGSWIISELSIQNVFIILETISQWIFNFYPNWMNIRYFFSIQHKNKFIPIENGIIFNYIWLWTYLYFAFIKIIIVIWNCSRIGDFGDKTIWKYFRVSLCECVYKLILCFFCLVRSSCFVQKKVNRNILFWTVYTIQSNIKKKLLRSNT